MDDEHILPKPGRATRTAIDALAAYRRLYWTPDRPLTPHRRFVLTTRLDGYLQIMNDVDRAAYYRGIAKGR